MKIETLGLVANMTKSNLVGSQELETKSPFKAATAIGGVDRSY
jgi:hypothetical protein